MNCERARENLVNNLAAGESAPSGELALHIRSCDGCRSFYENETKLLVSIDAGVQSMANQEMPPSLLPGLRARLSEQPSSGRAWLPTWGFATAVAAVAVLIVTFGHLGRRPQAQPNLSTNSISAPARVSDPAPTEQLVPESNATWSPVTHHRANPAILAPVSIEASSEVIVLTEEREAFARFVAEIPQRQEVAVALTKPALAQPDLPVEIALVRIDQMELKPLEQTPDN